MPLVLEAIEGPGLLLLPPGLLLLLLRIVRRVLLLGIFIRRHSEATVDERDRKKISLKRALANLMNMSDVRKRVVPLYPLLQPRYPSPGGVEITPALYFPAQENHT
jgi:hypothetical protein